MLFRSTLDGKIELFMADVGSRYVTKQRFDAKKMRPWQLDE